MAEKTEQDIFAFSTRRIEALTDGMFAIAMTLLVLDLKVDFGHLGSTAALWDQLYAIRDKFVTFVVSFMLLSSMWAVHTRQFEFIKKTDRHLTLINNLRLLAVVFIPLTTSLAGNYNHLALGRILLPINFFAISALSRWEWNYAVDPKHGLSAGLPSADVQYFSLRNRAILIMALAVVVVSAFIGDIAFLLFLGVPLLNKSRLLALERKIQKK